MKLTIDTELATLVIENDGARSECSLYSNQAFAELLRLWVKVGWDRKYSYGFTWMGRPMIQLPEDVIRIQETIYRIKPDVLIETGVAHGGSLIFYASLFKAMGKGRVVGIDIEIRPHNRKAIEDHELAAAITLIEGSSTATDTLEKARAQIAPNERVLVILDSNHLRDHVAQELRMYSPLVTQGSYIIATDGIMEEVYDVPHGTPSWKEDNPASAARAFAREHPEFELETQPPFLFNETQGSVQATYWPSAYLRRR